MIYLDYNASSLIPQSILNSMQTLELANPSSVHQSGQMAHDLVETSRERIAQFIGARPDQIVFTNGGTESNNMVIQHFAKQDGFEIISSPTEHPSVFQVCEYFKQKGHPIHYVKVDANGQVDIKDLNQKITSKTQLISIMSANNETGQYQPISEIINIAKSRQIKVHVDASQSLGRHEFNVQDWDLDYMTLSAHKAYGPQGIAALYLKNPLSIEPMIFGGGQEFGMRSGTQNVSGIFGFKLAIDYLDQHSSVGIPHLAQLKSIFIDGLNSQNISYKINGDEQNSLPNTLNLRFPGISGHKLMMNLDLAGICVSTGSACSTGSVDPSPVLLAMGQTETEALESIRVSWGYESRPEDIKTLIEKLSHILERLNG